MQNYSEPWNPRAFLEGEKVTFPYQHESVIFYRAEPIESFFGKRSIIKKRYIEAANGFYTNGGKKGEGKEYSAKSHGVFGGFLETAKFYARGNEPDPILKLEVPSSDLVTIFVPKEEWSKRGKHGDPETGSLNNLKQMKNYYGSPEKMRQVALRSLEEREGFGGYEFIMFMVPHEVPVNKQNNWIKGVWDYSFHDIPKWENLGHFVETIKTRYPERTPESIDPNRAKKKIKEELKEIDEIGKLLKKINHQSLRFDERVIKANKASELPDRVSKPLKNQLHKYDERLNRIYSIIREEFDIPVERQGPKISHVAQINRKSIRKISEDVKSIKEDAQEIDQEERRHAKSILRDNENAAEIYKKEARYEQKVEKRISEEISQLPVFTELEEKL